MNHCLEIRCHHKYVVPSQLQLLLLHFLRQLYLEFQAPTFLCPLEADSYPDKVLIPGRLERTAISLTSHPSTITAKEYDMSR